MSQTGALTVNLDGESLTERIQMLEKFVQEHMKPEIDYGVIEGTKQRTLFKPGAEKLCDFFGLTKGDPIVEEVRDSTQMPLYLKYKVYLPLLNRSDNSRVSTGLGSCNSHEKKYKWRWVYERDIPAGIDKSTLKKNQWGKYRILNDEVDDLDNTILKMAAKRAYIDAVLGGTCSSYLFTQDLDEQATNSQSNNSGNRNQQDAQRQKTDSNTPNGHQKEELLTKPQQEIIFAMKEALEIPDQNFRFKVAKTFEGKDLPALTVQEANKLIDILVPELFRKVTTLKDAIGISDENLAQTIAQGAKGKTLQQLNPRETVDLIRYLFTLRSKEKQTENQEKNAPEKYEPSDKARWIKGVLNDDLVAAKVGDKDAYVFSLKDGPKVALAVTHPWAESLHAIIQSGKIAHFWAYTIEPGLEVVSGKSGAEVKCQLPGHDPFSRPA